MNAPTHITNESISSALAYANKIADQVEASENFYRTARALVASGISSGLIAAPKKKGKQYNLEGRKEIVASINEMNREGMSHAKAAAVHGINAHTFYNWRKELI